MSVLFKGCQEVVTSKGNIKGGHLLIFVPFGGFVHFHQFSVVVSAFVVLVSDCQGLTRVVSGVQSLNYNLKLFSPTLFC